MPSEPSPKERFTSLDLRAVVREARPLVGARLDKAFDLAPEGIGLVLRGRGTGRQEVRLVPGRYGVVVAGTQEHAEGLSPLAREIRRVATGSVLRAIAEPGGERYLELEFARGDGSGSAVVAAELFGTGNLLVSRDGTIAAVAHPRRWAHRDVRSGASYARPPERADPLALPPSAIQAELVRSRSDLASTLAARLSLGGPVAEEVIARGGWAPSAAAATRAAELAAGVHRVLRELLAEIADPPRGYLVRREGVAVDATPYRSRRWDGIAGVEVVERRTFSEAALEFFASLVPVPAPPEELARRAERASLERQRDRQRAAVEALANAAAERKADAEAVYAHYAEAEAALRRAGALPAAARPRTVNLGGREVGLASAGTPREAAQALYEEGKRIGVKLEGARQALAATEARLASAEPASPALPRRAAASTPRTARWFEKFRWFVSSQGLLVLAGRDAPSNDLLVRRHLKDGDLYVHADLHGAASVVVKRAEPTSPVAEETVREAAQWAVAFSKAWRAGLASATAFWATSDQVSKSAASGEFVPRGAWVVRGTKHFVPEVPLELGVGTIRYVDEEWLAVAPPAAVRARGAVRFLLSPGEERERADREIELARELGVPRTRLQGLLPAGGLTVRRP